MPPLPTSLIVVGLVAAWLVVLVPMVAKRREHVPESDEDSAGFRVLRRASQSLRRRPVFSRTAVRASDGQDGPIDEDPSSDAFEDAYEDMADDMADDMSGDSAEDEWEPDDWDEPADETGRADVTARGGDEVAAEFDDRADDSPDQEFDEVPAAGGAERRRAVARDAAEEWAAERVRPRYQPGRDRGSPSRGEWRDRDRGSSSRDEWRDRDRDVPARDDWQDRDRLRPVPLRPGRGGFDPRAAEQAKAYRYRQRRRVALVLLALAVLGAVLGVLGISVAWAGCVVATVLLALYLAYLRRQVRIEESIRRRRAARLERARQIRPVYRASVAEQVRAHRTGSLRRPEADDERVEGYRVRSHARPTSTVPPQYHTRGVPVDLDDDDPAFDDLEYYRPVTYRRAAGE